MICPLLELTGCAQGRGDCIMGKFAELGKEYDVIVTQVTANQGLGFELLSASFAEALSSLLASREESRLRDYTFDFAEEG